MAARVERRNYPGLAPVATITLEEHLVPTPTNIRQTVEKVTNGVHDKHPLLDGLLRAGRRVFIGVSASNIVAHVQPTTEKRHFKRNAVMAAAVAGGVAGGLIELIMISQKRARRSRNR